MTATALTWEQKLAACQALSDASLCMRAPGDWYVSQNVDVLEAENASVIVGRYGNGTSPEDAVEDHFNRLTAEQPLHCVIARQLDGSRRRVRWNGFMWIDVMIKAEAVS